MRPRPTKSDLAAVLRPLGNLDQVEELTGGMFASAYRVTLADGTRAVVKVSGTNPAHLCRYERDIARTEAETYRTLAQHGLPVPAVLLTDFSHAVVSGDVVVTSHLSGTPWNERQLDADAERAAKRALGALMADLHRVPAPAFGYPAPAAGLQAADWRSAFTLMVEALLADAAETGTPLPADRIRAAVRAHHEALDDVAASVIVHTDLWPANLFLADDDGGPDAGGRNCADEDDGAGPSIVGLIDTERTVWGDPLLDLIGADQFGLWDVDPEVLAGNSAAGGVLAEVLDGRHGRTRFALCRLYFSMILVAEIPRRGYQGEWLGEHRARVNELVEAALVWLEGAAVRPEDAAH